MSVVQGEDDESDEEVYGSGRAPAAVVSAQVVPGEASESDEEDEETPSDNVPIELESPSSSRDPQATTVRRPEYDT